MGFLIESEQGIVLSSQGFGQDAGDTVLPNYHLTVYPRGGGNSHTLPIRVCAAQRGRDFEAPDLERGIHFIGVF